MKRLLLLPVLAALLLAAPSALAATKTVSITNLGFVPNEVELAAGDSITWTNSDSKNRQVISQDAEFASPILRPGETYTFQFKATGKFTVADAINRNHRMTVTVKKAPPAAAAPTLAANRKKVVYGGAVVLTGKLPVARAGERVTLRAAVLTRTGTTQTSTIAQVDTNGEGAFSFRIAPSSQTTYTASWRPTPPTTSTSNPVVVRVAPRIGLGVVRKSGRTVTFSTKATSTVPYAGRVVFLQRRNALGRWVSLKRVVLRSSTTVTRTSARLPRGLSRIRVLMPQSQVGIGYVTGVSRVVLVRL